MSETSPFVRRPEADRCPGALRLLAAADGFLARVRLPGGLVAGEQLRALARLASTLGDGRAELTSRGNVQLRRLPATAAAPLAAELEAAGLLPSPSHERVRNILASPLAGLDSGPDLTSLVRALDAALCARPRLAALPGRFLFALDDGRGDIAALGADVTAALLPEGTAVNGLAVHPGNLIKAMLACGEAFLDLQAAHDANPNPTNHANPTNRTEPTNLANLGDPADPAGSPDPTGPFGAAWRIADLPDGAARVRDLVATRLGFQPATLATGATTATSATSATSVPASARTPVASASYRPVGLIGNSAVLLAPLGRLTSAQLTWIADRLGDEPARVTPWRSVVLPHLADPAGTLREAAGLGFGTDEASPWLRVTACAGRPGCASALADVQADAAGLAARWPQRRVHVSGCARHCGRPAGTEIDVTATSEGYQVAGV